MNLKSTIEHKSSEYFHIFLFLTCQLVSSAQQALSGIRKAGMCTRHKHEPTADYGKSAYFAVYVFL